MPVRPLSRKTDEEANRELLGKLLEEWRHPDPTAIQPIILEKNDPDRGTFEVYVVWDEWTKLTAMERSELNVEAYSRRVAAPATLHLIVAKGPTAAEADRMGIN